MPLLQVRNCPQELYETLTKKAELEHRSIAQETIVLLREKLQVTEVEERRARRRAAIARISDFHLEHTDEWPDPATLIREDRDNR